MPPEIVGRYRLLAPLGGMSEKMIYHALAQDTQQAVALRLIPLEAFPKSKLRRQFLEDARAASRLAHPGVRRLYEVNQNETHIYLALEYLEGANLRSLLLAGPVAVETALAWAEEIADALAAAHSQGLTQGELRPTKVFITQQGTVKLLDTGLWRAAIPVGADLTSWKPVVSMLPSATFAALAPEQIRGRPPDARSDIFAFGTLLYEMIAGGNPFADRDPMQTMHWVLERTSPPLSESRPEVSAALDALLERALEKEPKARFASAKELARTLRALSSGEREAVLIETEPVSEGKRSSRALLWIATGGLLLAALVLAYLLLSRF